MDHPIALYQKRLNLQGAQFSLIDHDDAMVAIVYLITDSNGNPFILKICERQNDYLREVYFLSYFANRLPVPRIIQLLEPKGSLPGAILMEYLSGALLTAASLTDELSFEIGSLLARIHEQRASGYGDLITPKQLSPKPHPPFTAKFEEGLEECRDHLSKALLDQCRSYYSAHVHLLDSVDGPCMIHRDFRLGNLIVSDGKVKGIIDWSSARARFAEDDFCSMEHEQWAINLIGKPSFLSGYGSVRPVPNYQAMMPFLRLNRALAIVGFTVKRGTFASRDARVYQANRQFLEVFMKQYI